MNRTKIINYLIEINQYKSYLEIGVDNPNINFNKISCQLKHGVDPAVRYSGIFKMTSDRFFLTNRRKYDLIFIDGLHHCGQVEKDILNAINSLNRDGTIVVHDCNPTSKEMQIVPRIQGEWTGDVWKAWANIYRQFGGRELKMQVLDCDYGVGIITVNKKIENYTPINPNNLSYEDFAKNKIELLNLKSAELPFIDIIIPAFEQYGHGAKTLIQCLNSIYQQTYTNYEIHVIDNANDDSIYTACNLHDIKYIKSKSRGTSINMNIGQDSSYGNIIKPMFQDDIFVNKKQLEYFAFQHLLYDWVISAGYSIDANNRIKKIRGLPHWNKSIYTEGKNTIGMPSVISYKKDTELIWDANLKTLLDCDFYYQLFNKYGLPGVIKNPGIGSRYWEGSTSRNQENFLLRELPLIENKYA